MIGPFGVLSQGMTLVTFVYGACGFVGYVSSRVGGLSNFYSSFLSNLETLTALFQITYGDKVQGSITLNLPSTTWVLTPPSKLHLI